MSTKTYTREEVIDLLGFIQTGISFCDCENSDGCFDEAMLKVAVDKWPEWKKGRTEVHDGDCLHVPMSCLRCVMNDLDLNSAKILTAYDRMLDSKDNKDGS